MFAMFQRLFSSLSMWFIAFENLGSAASHITGWTNESAAALADEARVQRQQRLLALNAETAKLQAAIATAATPAIAADQVS